MSCVEGTKQSYLPLRLVDVQIELVSVHGSADTSSNLVHQIGLARGTHISSMNRFFGGYFNASHFVFKISYTIEKLSVSTN